jgi:aspartate dehydrogenase
LGASKTRVEIWTSRGYRGNRHEIQIESASGDIRIQLKNVPSASNPKTSALAFYSAMALLRRIFSSVRIGT